MTPESPVDLPVGSRACQCVPMDLPVKLVVLTGGPGGGKTAVLEMARRSFCRHVAILPEAAGIVFGGGFPRSDALETRIAGQRAIYHVQRQLEYLACAATGQIAVALCDRGTIDGSAYWPLSGRGYWDDLRVRLDDEVARYAAVIHLRTPATDGGFDHSNPLRRENAEQAARLDEGIVDAWSGHARRTIVPSTVDFLEKARLVLGLVRNELPPCCHGHDLNVGS
jgi:predicted ATPase